MRILPTFVAVTALSTGAALAQSTTPATTPATPPAMAPASPAAGTATGSSNNAVNPSGDTGSSVNASGTIQTVAPSALEKGANSFTQGQAQSRIESAGFTNVTDLQKDDQGIWRGKAMKGGKSVAVGFDYKGNLAAE